MHKTNIKIQKTKKNALKKRAEFIILLYKP